MKIAVFSSGTGTNFAEILGSIKLKQIKNVRIILLFSDRPVLLPGGSIRDEESKEEPNKHGIAMVFTGIRHFKH